MDDKAILESLVAKIQARLPGFEIRYKDESRLQKLIGFLLFFNKAYMTSFITTMFGKVYFPTRSRVEENPRGTWKTLAHEYVHLLDDRDHKLFKPTYLYPQILAAGALLALGAFWCAWALLCLLCLVALAPWPAKYRTKWEMRGYAMSMAVNFWRYGRVTLDQMERIGENFWGPNYYYMCRSERKVRMQLKAIETALQSSSAAAVTHPLAVVDVKAVLRAHGALKELTLA